MSSFTNFGRRIATTAATATMMVLGACAGETPASVAPVLPSNPGVPAQYRGAAFIMDVSALKKTVKVTAPAAGVASKTASLNLLGGEPQMSLLGGDAVDLTTSNFSAGAVGAVVPGKVLITFDLQVNNKLDGYQLTTPTFPTPPAGVTGVQAFPFEITVTTTAGGVGTVGNEIVVASPRFGVVVPSSDWGNLPLGDGDFHNFFNDTGCTSTANDCYRYEPFAPIAPLNSSAAQRVGFLIDPTVGDFRVKLILAADLQPTVTAAPGTVAGTVTSNIGPVQGATISVTGGFSGSSAANGTFSITGVASGNNKTVSIGNLPSGCSASPASYSSLTVPAAGTLTQNFSVTCAVPTGNVLGTITSVQGANLSGVNVVVTPTSGAALAAVTTSSTGAYTRTLVPTFPTTGTVTLSNLPAGCVNAGPYAYTGHTTAGTTKDIVVNCPPAPTTYPLTGVWGAITNTGTTGRQVTLTFSINMGSAPGSATINGTAADELAGISFSAAYNGLGLDYISRTLTGAGGEFDLGVVNEIGQGTAGAQANVAIGSTSGLTITGSQSLIRLTFNIATGFSGTITPVVTVSEALATTSLINVTSSVTVSVPAITIP
jgi:hypothetical protein